MKPKEQPRIFHETKCFPKLFFVLFENGINLNMSYVWKLMHNQFNKIVIHIDFISLC